MTRDLIEKFDKRLRREVLIKNFDAGKPTSVFDTLWDLSLILIEDSRYKSVFAGGFCNLYHGARKDETFLAFDQENQSVSFPYKGKDGKWVKGTLTIHDFVDECSDQEGNFREAIQNLSLFKPDVFNDKTLGITIEESQQAFFEKFLEVVFLISTVGAMPPRKSTIVLRPCDSIFFTDRDQLRRK